MEVEDNVELTHIPKIPIQQLDKVMHDLQCHQLVVVLLDPRHEVERGISLEDQLEIHIVEKVGQSARSADYHAADLG